MAGALTLLAGCFSNNGGFLDLDSGGGGTGGIGPDGGFAGAGGGAGNGGAGGGSGGNGGSGGGAGSSGSGGNPLTGSWQAPVMIESHEGIGLKPQVAIGTNGEVMSVWVQSYLAEYKVWANRYVAATGWGTDELIGDTDGNVADLTKTSEPHVVVDDDGIATAAWGDYPNPIVRGLVARRYSQPDGWGAEEIIYDGGSTAADPRLAVDASGRVMAAFATGTGAWANYYEPGVGWGGAAIIDNQPGAPSSVGVALTPDGNGWAIWSQAPTGLLFNVFGNAFDPGSGWAEAEKIEQGTTASALAPRLALDAQGNAIFVWQQTAGLQYHVWSNRWSATANTLTNPIRIDAASTAYAPAVASDPSGNGTAVWLQSTQSGGTPLQVAVSRYTPGLGWSAPETLADGGVTSNPRVAMDSEGNAIVAYTRLAPPETLADAWAHTYSGGEWSGPVLLGLDRPNAEEDPAFQPSLAMDPNGNAMVVWREGPDIWAAAFE